MSEGTSEVSEQEEDKAATKRKVLTMGDRTKVIDYLRSRVEPIAADTGAAIAQVVSEATKVDISWQQLKYMIDDVSMEEWKLSEKVHIKSAPSSDADRVAALEAKVEDLLTRILRLEANP